MCFSLNKKNIFVFLNDALHKGSIQVLDERADKGHLFAGVVENDFRIRGVAAQAVWGHDHR